MFFKEKWQIGDFIRQLIVASFRGAFDISRVDPENILSSTERQWIDNNLRTFLLVVLHYLFLEKIMQGKLEVDAQKFGHQFGMASTFAFHDLGLSPDEASYRAESFLNELW
ncbi:MAG: hypothetical protein ACR2IB_03465 [Pyrinomonadaceae bacterium]